MHYPSSKCTPYDSDGRKVRTNIQFKYAYDSDGNKVRDVIKRGGDQWRNQPCWKHFRIMDETFRPQDEATTYKSDIVSIHDFDRMTSRVGENVTYLVSLKSPLAWITSECEFRLANDRYNKKRNKKNNDTLTNLECKDELVFEGKLDEWLRYVEKWIDLKSRDPARIVIVPYEVFLADTHHVCQKLDQFFGAQVFAKVETYARYEKPLAGTKTASWSDQKTKYLSCSYLSKLSEALRNKFLKIVSQHLRVKFFKFDSHGCVHIDQGTFEA
jgi:hypothetical protein